MRKRRVFQEEAKTRQTSHWDWDYLPMTTLERLTRAEPPATPDSPPASPARGRRLKTALACIVAGTLLMAALLTFILVDLRAV